MIQQIALGSNPKFTLARQVTSLSVQGQHSFRAQLGSCRESANRARTYMHGKHGALWPPLYPGTAQGVQGLPWVVGMMPSGHAYTLAQQKQAC